MQEQQLLANGDGGQAPAQPSQDTSSTPAPDAAQRQSSPTLELSRAAPPPQTAANATADSRPSQPAQPQPVPALSALMPVPMPQGLPAVSGQPVDRSDAAAAAIPAAGFGPLLQDLQKVQVCNPSYLLSCRT